MRMTRKSNRSETRGEPRSETVDIPSTPDDHRAPAPPPPASPSSDALVARLRLLEEGARKRLAGTSAEALARRVGSAVEAVASQVEATQRRLRGVVTTKLERGLDGRLHNLCETRLDPVLDRVGLVRKRRLTETRRARAADTPAAEVPAAEVPAAELSASARTLDPPSAATAA